LNLHGIRVGGPLSLGAGTEVHGKLHLMLRSGPSSMRRHPGPHPDFWSSAAFDTAGSPAGQSMQRAVWTGSVGRHGETGSSGPSLTSNSPRYSGRWDTATTPGRC
jgi:hypothetical protein